MVFVAHFSSQGFDQIATHCELGNIRLVCGQWTPANCAQRQSTIALLVSDEEIAAALLELAAEYKSLADGLGEERPTRGLPRNSSADVSALFARTAKSGLWLFPGR